MTLNPIFLIVSLEYKVTKFPSGDIFTGIISSIGVVVMRILIAFLSGVSTFATQSEPYFGIKYSSITCSHLLSSISIFKLGKVSLTFPVLISCSFAQATISLIKSEFILFETLIESISKSHLSAISSVVVIVLIFSYFASSDNCTLVS